MENAILLCPGWDSCGVNSSKIHKLSSSQAKCVRARRFAFEQCTYLQLLQHRCCGCGRLPQGF
jgi:hypothetical protein